MRYRVTGTSYWLHQFASQVKCPVYALECTADAPLGSIEQLATHYTAAVRHIQPDGSYRIAGYSMGAMVAFEMALQLQSKGHVIDQLILLDGSHAFVNAYVSLQKQRLVGAEVDCQILCGFMMQFVQIDHKQVIITNLLLQ